MAQSDQNIHIEIERMNETCWHETLDQFHDASIYQTHTYGALHWPGSEMSHLVVKSGETVIAAAQVIIKKFPSPGLGIAYLYRGPLWRTTAFPYDPGIFRLALRALTDEFVVKRKLFLRVIPNEPDRGEEGIAPVLAEEKFIKHNYLKFYRTIMLNLIPPMEELRTHFVKSWKTNLKLAEKSQLQVSFSRSDEDYQEFLSLYEEMVANKKFIPGVDVFEFAKVHSGLPERYKFLIGVARHQNESVATVLCTLAGRQAIYILGASNVEARDLKASFILHWEMIRQLKEKNIQVYDLGGIDPEKTPGPYQFKAGLGGEDVTFVGTWDRCQNLFVFHFLRMADRAYILVKILKSFLKKKTLEK